MRTAAADLAARARIRNAAIELFGREGFHIGLRTIAEEAGVSLGLIRHHFGSKADLRAACDTWVLDEIRRLKEEQTTADDPAAAMLARLSSTEDHAYLVRYLSQALSAGGDLATSFLERMIADADVYLQEGVASGVIKPSVDPAARARFLVLAVVGGMQLASVMAPHEPPHESWRDWADWSTLPALELYTQGLMTDGTILDAYMKYMKDPPEEAAGA